MRFSQLFLRMGKDVNVEVFSRKYGTDNNVKGEFVDSFQKRDNVPGKIWSGFVRRILPISHDTIAVIVEDYKDERQN